MDDQVNDTVQDQAAPEAQAPTFSPEQQALMNKVVAREKGKAADSARREVEQKYQQDMEALSALRQQQAQRNSQVSPQVDANTIYQELQEKFNQDRMKNHMNEVAGNYLQNLEKARSSYEDFDEVMKPAADPSQFPQLVLLTSGLPNGGDVMYDLFKNPNKMANLNYLATTIPDLARNELLKLSKSIADNKSAQAESQNQNVSEPLDRLTPSKIAGSNGKMSVSDLRNQSWLRG